MDICGLFLSSLQAITYLLQFKKKKTNLSYQKTFWKRYMKNLSFLEENIINNT